MTALSVPPALLSMEECAHVILTSTRLATLRLELAIIHYMGPALPLETSTILHAIALSITEATVYVVRVLLHIFNKMLLHVIVISF